MNPLTSTAMPDPEWLGLHDLPAHTHAQVLGVRASTTGDEREIALRLLEIGFLPGEDVRIIAHGSPGRDPLAVRIGRSTFALRRHEAALVGVKLQASAKAGTR